MAKKGKKKKKTPSSAAQNTAASSTDEDLLPCERAYESGNYAMARRLALAAPAEQAKRARAVLDVISVDRLPLLVFVACLVLISSIALLGLGQ